MSSVIKNLGHGEKPLLQAQVHWFIFVPSLIIIGISAAICNRQDVGLLFQEFKENYEALSWYKFALNIPNYIGSDWKSSLCVVLAIVGVLTLLRALLRFTGWKMYVTNMKVMFIRGVFTTNTLELYFNNVESIDVKQSFIGKIFNFGNVFFNATGYGALIFRKVKDPTKIKRLTLEAIKRSVME